MYINPRYNNDNDYNTNAPSYYDELARKNKLIELLSKKIWEYDKELAKRFDEWDKNLEEFDDEVMKLLRSWINDGTMAAIINEEIFSWKADKVDLDRTNEELLLKADYNEMVNLIQAMDSGVKGTYPDLTTLLSEKPDGDTGNFVLESDGHVYHWNGATWIDTGIQYQSTGIAEKSINEEKTTFIKKVPTSINLFDKTKRKTNTGINGTDGNYYSPTNSFVSNKVEVKDNMRYSFLYTESPVRSYRVVEKNKSGDILDFKTEVSYYETGSNSSGNTIEVMANEGAEDYFMIIEGSVEPLNYIPYTEKNEVYNLQYKAPVNEDNISFMKRTSPNLFNKEKTIKNARLNNVTEKIVYHADNDITDYIPVKPNTDYVVTEGNSTFHFNESKVLIGTHGTGILKFRTLPNQYYVMTTVRHVHMNDMMLVEGDTLPSEYHPYNEYTLNENIKTLSDNQNNVNPLVKWLSLGDSITEGLDEYPNRANEKLGFTLENAAVGGTSMAMRTGANESFNPDSFVYKTKNTIDFSNYTLATIGYGTNDWSNAIPLGTINSVDEYTFMGALNVGIQKMYEDNPTIQIVLITPPYRKNADKALNSLALELIDYVNALKEISNKYNISVIDFYNQSGWNEFTIDYYTNDGLHPNNTGQIILGGLTYQSLNRF